MFYATCQFPAWEPMLVFSAYNLEDNHIMQKLVLLIVEFNTWPRSWKSWRRIHRKTEQLQVQLLAHFNAVSQYMRDKVHFLQNCLVTLRWPFENVKQPLLLYSHPPTVMPKHSLVVCMGGGWILGNVVQPSQIFMVPYSLILFYVCPIKLNIIIFFPGWEKWLNCYRSKYILQPILRISTLHWLFKISKISFNQMTKNI